MKRKLCAFLLCLAMLLAACGQVPPDTEEAVFTEPDDYTTEYIIEIEYESTELPELFPQISLLEGSTPGAEVMVAAGNGSSFAIHPDGTLWGWGTTPVRYDRPALIMDDVIAISAGGWGGGGDHMMAIRSDGSLWGWGRNSHGQLGNGETSHSLRPDPVHVMDDVVAVSAGMAHTMAIRRDGSLWGWGENMRGQLGDGTTTCRYSPVHIMDDVVAVSAGTIHTMAITSNGDLWAWGVNRNGMLGTSEPAHLYRSTDPIHPEPVMVMSDVAQVSAWWNQTLVVRTDGTLWQLGATSEKIMDNVVAVAAGDGRSRAIRTDNTLWTWGTNFGDPVQILDDVVAVSSRNSHTLALRADGSVWTWGHGALGRSVLDRSTSGCGTPAPVDFIHPEPQEQIPFPEFHSTWPTTYAQAVERLVFLSNNEWFRPPEPSGHVINFSLMDVDLDGVPELIVHLSGFNHTGSFLVLNEYRATLLLDASYTEAFEITRRYQVDGLHPMRIYQNASTGELLFSSHDQVAGGGFGHTITYTNVHTLEAQGWILCFFEGPGWHTHRFAESRLRSREDLIAGITVDDPPDR
ncbi:MAG: hypothetical protein FWD84_04970, partial [Oscillospiraceae bacterium]|nr:hypothetical protein [Oscillospiraceae bacterium]